MDKITYKNKHLAISKEIKELCDAKIELETEYKNGIINYLESIGLKYGKKVNVIRHDNSNIECTFNGVKSDCFHEFYLEFTYPLTIDQIRFGMTMEYITNHPNTLCPEEIISIDIDGKLYSYNDFIEKFIS